VLIVCRIPGHIGITSNENADQTAKSTLQSNPIFIVKTQLTERSGITDKHRENHIKKHHEH